MSVTLTIKNVPDELAAALRARASRNHRSLQGELMCMLEAMAAPAPAVAAEHQPRRKLVEDLLALTADSTLGAGPWLTREEANERPLRINQTPAKRS